jgi:hypothetical protein
LTPHNEMVLPAVSILESGKWPITARNDQFFVDDLYNRYFTTPRWEDSVLVAELVEKLLQQDFDQAALQYATTLHDHRARIVQDRTQIFRVKNACDLGEEEGKGLSK